MAPEEQDSQDSLGSNHKNVGIGGRVREKEPVPPPGRGVVDVGISKALGKESLSEATVVS